MKGLLIPVIDRKLGYSQYYVELLNFDRRVGKSMEAVMLDSCNFIRIQPYIFWVRLRFPKIISVLPQRWVLWICGTYVCCNCFTMLTSPGGEYEFGWLAVCRSPASGCWSTWWGATSGSQTTPGPARPCASASQTSSRLVCSCCYSFLHYYAVLLSRSNLDWLRFRFMRPAPTPGIFLTQIQFTL